jgi:hypothetical protein
MGKFVLGLLIGLTVGLVFADSVFPDGFDAAVQRWGVQIRSEMPGR